MHCPKCEYEWNEISFDENTQTKEALKEMLCEHDEEFDGARLEAKCKKCGLIRDMAAG